MTKARSWIILRLGVPIVVGLLGKENASREYCRTHTMLLFHEAEKKMWDKTQAKGLLRHFDVDCFCPAAEGIHEHAGELPSYMH